MVVPALGICELPRYHFHVTTVVAVGLFVVQVIIGSRQWHTNLALQSADRVTVSISSTLVTMTVTFL